MSGSKPKSVSKPTAKPEPKSRSRTKALAAGAASSQRDALVVGAGPAGCVAAKLLAEAGHSVTVLEAAPAAGQRPIACGGWLSRKAGEMFPWLEAAAGELTDTPFSGLVFHSPELRDSAEFAEKAGASSGWLVDRSVFDAGLARLAAAAGAEFRFGQRVIRVVAGEQDVRATTESGADFVGRVLLAADGAGGRIPGLFRPAALALPRMLGAAAVIKSKPAKLEKLFGKNRPLHLMLGFAGLNGHGFLLARKSAIAVGLLGRDATEAELPGRFASLLSGLSAKGLLPEEAVPAPSPILGCVPAGAALDGDEHVGKRILRIGDAGGFAASVVGEGLFPAIWSARLAAETASNAFAAPRSQFQDVLLTFESRWRTGMAEYLRMPNTNMKFLLPLIFSNRQMADRFARAVLYGTNI